jgi:hypothetical protein
MAWAAPIEPRSLACPLARAPLRPHGVRGLALSAPLQVGFDLAVTRGELLVIQVSEGHRRGHGQEGLLTPRALERRGDGLRVVLAAIMPPARPPDRVTLPGQHRPPARHPGRPRHLTDPVRPRAVHRRPGLWPRRDVRAGLGQEPGPRPQRAAPHAHLSRRAARAGQQAQGQEPLPPRAGVPITRGPPLDRRHLGRLDPQPRNAPALQERTQREPIAPGRGQGHGRAPARRSPVGQRLSGNRVCAKAAPRLGIVTGRHRHSMCVGPHVDARRVPGDGGQVGWERGLGARLLRLAGSHGRLRHHREHRPRQWGRERRRGRTLPHGIRAMPVPTGAATGSRDHPHQRAHRTLVPTASHGPRPRRE